MNKAQIGEYASQHIDSVLGEHSFEYNLNIQDILVRRSVRPRSFGKSDLWEPTNARSQLFGGILLVTSFISGNPVEKVAFEIRQKSPRKNQDFKELAEEILDIWDQVPEEELKNIPKDASEKLNKYLYGMLE
jgi:hypothetical protein